MIGYAFLAEEAAAVGSDEQIVLDAYAAKVFVCFQQVEVEKFSAVARCAPIVNQRRNEVDAGFVGYNESFFQPSAHAQGVGAKLVENYLTDLTPKEEYERIQMARQYGFEKRDRGAGRPTKRDRREIEEFKYK